MFRKIKKLYFKIYHLFKLLGIFIIFFIFSLTVKADTCINLYKGELNNLLYQSSGSFNYITSSLDSSTQYNTNTTSSCDSSTTLCLDSSKSYTLFAYNSNDEYFNLDLPGYRRLFVSGSLVSRGGSLNPTRYSYTFTPQNNQAVFQYEINNSNYNTSLLDTMNSYQWAVVEGTEPCIPISEPPTPPTPTPDTTYSSFLTIYFDRFLYLANGFTTNPYLLAMISIIFSFVVLEIFLLFFHLKGGRRK